MYPLVVRRLECPTKGPAFLLLAAKVEAAEAAIAGEKARLTAIESRLEEQYVSLTEAVVELQGRLSKIEQKGIKFRFLKLLRGISRFHQTLDSAYGRDR